MWVVATECRSALTFEVYNPSVPRERSGLSTSLILTASLISLVVAHEYARQPEPSAFWEHEGHFQLFRASGRRCLDFGVTDLRDRFTAGGLRCPLAGRCNN